MSGASGIRMQQESKQSVVGEEFETSGLTLADIDADVGKGSAGNSTVGKFYATTEDFIASLWADRNGSTS